jgi:hypothetical protein
MDQLHIARTWRTQLMRRLFAWLPVFAAVLLASCSLTLFDYSGIVSKRFALVYGVTVYASAYPAGSYPNLNYPDSDARAVAAMLQSEGYQVVLRYTDGTGNEWLAAFSSPAVQTGSLSTDPSGANGPSKSNITADIQTYFESAVGQNDVFVFYFSGHGMQTTTSPPVEYFVPEGAVQLSGGEYTGVASLSVADYELGAILSPLSTSRKVVILDTCNSGGFIGNSLEADAIPQASNGSSGGISVQTLAQAVANYLSFPASTSGLSPYGGAMVLSAAGRDESAYEAASPYNHGVMTYYLLRAPLSGDLNHDGHVTVAEAFSLAKAGIETENPGNTYSFEPRISGGLVDFVLW